MAQHVLDVADLVEGMVKMDTFPKALDRHDWKRYQDGEVYLKGCSPTWAYMMTQQRLQGIARKIYFGAPDDKPVEIK